MKIGIIIQARMSSTRLPGKVMKLLAGKEVLGHVVERCRQARLAQEVIVATSTDESDTQLVRFCEANGISCFRGSLNNVLSRYYHCAKEHSLGGIVRITSDCPLIDPTLIDEMIEIFVKYQENIDYVSNFYSDRIFPRGLDCEVFSFAALEEAYEKATLPAEIEHVTPYIIKNKRGMGFEVALPYQGNFRLTLDQPEDYDLFTHVYEKFYHPREIIRTTEVIAYLKAHPEVAAINADVEQKKFNFLFSFFL